MQRTRQYSRRTLLRAAVGAAGTTLLASCSVRRTPGAQQSTSAAVVGQEAEAGSSTTFAAPSSAVNAAGVSVFPSPNSLTASPQTEISVRGVSAGSLDAALESIDVLGSLSGSHTVILLPHADGKGGSFLPDFPFQAGEQVAVSGLNVHDDFQFTVGSPLSQNTGTDRQVQNDVDTMHSYHSRPDLHPPVVTLPTPAAGTAPGYLTVAPKGTPGQYGTMIVDNQARTIWFHRLAANDAVEATDFKVQRYQGQPVLSWYQGHPVQGHGLGHYVIVDSSYQPVATVRVGNGLPGGDMHDFMITPWDTALFLAYQPLAWDLSSQGGPKEGTVLDGIVQEVDIKTGRVLFEWHSLDHIALDESYNTPPKDGSIFDYLHHNSIDVDLDGNFILSGRHTWAIYKIDRKSGEIIWRLNGKQSDFKVPIEAQTAWQHDAKVQPDGRLSIFDNGWDGDSSMKHDQSRGLILKLDTENKTVSLTHEYTHPEKLLTSREGNMQVLPNGNVLLGWGNFPIVTEFDQEGKLIFDARFAPKDCESYRAYRFPWVGKPKDAPAIAAESGSGGEVNVYASWNGATEVASWEVLAGADQSNLAPVGSAPTPWGGFETSITVQTNQPYLAVRAMDNAKQVLGTSQVIKTPS